MDLKLKKGLAVFLLAVSVIFYLSSLLLLALIPVARIGRHSALWPFDPMTFALFTYSAIGAWIAFKRPENAVGWVFLAIGFSWMVFSVASAYISYDHLAALSKYPDSPLLLWLPTRLWIVPYAISPLLLFLFPDGAFLSRRWKLFAWLLLPPTLMFFISTGTIIIAGSNNWEYPSLLSLLGLTQLESILQNAMLILVMSVIGGAASFYLRFRASRGEVRQQLRWFIYAGSIFFLVMVAILMFGDQLMALDTSALVPADIFAGIPNSIAFMLIPIAAAVAILRYHLYEIDVIIRRTLIYAPLTLLLALVYAGCVIFLQQITRVIIGSKQSPLIIVISTLAIAALFAPLKGQVQRWIDRRFFRQRYDAEKLVSAFNTIARSETDINRLSGTFLKIINEAMQPDALSLWLPEQTGKEKHL